MKSGLKLGFATMNSRFRSEAWIHGLDLSVHRFEPNYVKTW